MISKTLSILRKFTMLPDYVGQKADAIIASHKTRSDVEAMVGFPVVVVERAASYHIRPKNPSYAHNFLRHEPNLRRHLLAGDAQRVLVVQDHLIYLEKTC